MNSREDSIKTGLMPRNKHSLNMLIDIKKMIKARNPSRETWRE